MDISKETSLDEFIKYPNWKEAIQNKPFSIKVTEKDGLIMLKYNQILSDMAYRFVRQCRGIILYADDLSVACRPFDKFFNYKETNAARIDWRSAVALEKVDGSLMKAWFNKRTGKWSLSTNGSIDAFSTDAPMPMEGIHTFGDMFHEVMVLPDELNVTGKIDGSKVLDSRHHTYLFEIVGPHNRVVVPHTEIALYYLGSAHNSFNLKLDRIVTESFPDIVEAYSNFRTPKQIALTDVVGMEELFEQASQLPYNDEGYVVSDDHFNMVKMKSEQYLSVHRLKGEDYPSGRRILESILQGTDDDFLGFFPEYKPSFDDVRKKLSLYHGSIDKEVDQFIERWKDEDDRKVYALEFAKGCINPALMFILHNDYRMVDSEKTKEYIWEFLKSIPTPKLLGYITDHWDKTRQGMLGE